MDRRSAGGGKAGLELPLRFQPARRPDPHADGNAVLPDRLGEDDARLLFEAQRVADSLSERRSRAGKGEGGSDIGMAREGQLEGRREDPHGRRVRRIGRRGDEDRFGIVELAGDPLHQLIVQPAGVGNHRQRIAAEPLVGEDVERQIAKAGYDPLRSWRAFIHPNLSVGKGGFVLPLHGSRKSLRQAEMRLMRKGEEATEEGVASGRRAAASKSRLFFMKQAQKRRGGECRRSSVRKGEINRCQSDGMRALYLILFAFWFFVWDVAGNNARWLRWTALLVYRPLRDNGLI